jgi:hypothetical protein
MIAITIKKHWYDLELLKGFLDTQYIKQTKKSKYVYKGSKNFNFH